jgi:gliding motility-associated-like protein
MPGYRCADTAYSKLLVYPSVKASFTSVGNCTGTPLQFTNTSAADIGEISNLTWTFTNTSDSTSFTTLVNNPAHVFPSPNQTYMVALDAVTTKGCEARDTQYINIWQSPYPLSPHDTVLTAGVPYQMHANAGYDSLGSFTWSPAIGLNNPYSANPIATGTEDITYRVQMENSHGCALTDTVHIVYYKGPDIYVPQAFTPNGDGHNDVFRPFPVGITHLEYFRVFDRWGRVVYQTNTYLAGWDGTLKGEPASPGAYVWEVRGVDYNNKTVFKRGTVVLLR